MPDFATLYIADPSLLGSRLFKQFQQIKSYEGINELQTGLAKGVQLKLPTTQIRLTFMAPAATPPHLQGFTGFAEGKILDADLRLYVLSRIQNVRLVIGVVIEPAFDEPTEEFLFQFNGVLNGLLFAADSIFDFNGEQLC